MLTRLQRYPSCENGQRQKAYQNIYYKPSEDSDQPGHLCRQSDQTPHCAHFGQPNMQCFFMRIFASTTAAHIRKLRFIYSLNRNRTLRMESWDILTGVVDALILSVKWVYIYDPMEEIYNISSKRTTNDYTKMTTHSMSKPATLI